MRINAAEREEHNFFMENDDLYWKEHEYSRGMSFCIRAVS
jgi:hypothetical protein